jgi:hypothetical protein
MLLIAMIIVESAIKERREECKSKGESGLAKGTALKATPGLITGRRAF